MKGERRQSTALASEEIESLGPLPISFDPAGVRVYRLGCSGAGGVFRRLVLLLSGGRAVALGNRIFLPAHCGSDPAVLAHELTHCAQYQTWGAWRYFSRGLAAQLRHLVHRRLGIGTSPYTYRLEEGKPFEAYGMEQQGQIVEDAIRGSAAARAIATPIRPPGLSPRVPRPPAAGPPIAPARFPPDPPPSP